MLKIFHKALTLAYEPKNWTKDESFQGKNFSERQNLMVTFVNLVSSRKLKSH